MGKEWSHIGNQPFSNDVIYMFAAWMFSFLNDPSDIFKLFEKLLPLLFELFFVFFKNTIFLLWRYLRFERVFILHKSDHIRLGNLPLAKLFRMMIKFKALVFAKHNDLSSFLRANLTEKICFLFLPTLFFWAIYTSLHFVHLSGQMSFCVSWIHSMRSVLFGSFLHVFFLLKLWKREICFLKKLFLAPFSRMIPWLFVPFWSSRTLLDSKQKKI